MFPQKLFWNHLCVIFMLCIGLTLSPSLGTGSVGCYMCASILVWTDYRDCVSLGEITRCCGHPLSEWRGTKGKINSSRTCPEGSEEESRETARGSLEEEEATQERLKLWSTSSPRSEGLCGGTYRPESCSRTAAGGGAPPALNMLSGPVSRGVLEVLSVW